MITAWCTEHRGVMRIAFFTPVSQHFNNPCPRCNKPLVQNPPRNPHDHTPWFKGTTTTAGRMDNVHKTCPDNAVCTHGCNEWMDPLGSCWRAVNGYVPPPTAEPFLAQGDEVITKAPRPLCSCCEHFKIRPDYTDLCEWCVDCPTGYCDIPTKYLMKKEK